MRLIQLLETKFLELGNQQLNWWYSIQPNATPGSWLFSMILVFVFMLLIENILLEPIIQDGRGYGIFIMALAFFAFISSFRIIFGYSISTYQNISNAMIFFGSYTLISISLFCFTGIRLWRAMEAKNSKGKKKEE